MKHKIRTWYPHVTATLALVVALTMGGAYAAERTGLIGSKQIKNGSITSADLKNNAVKSTDIGRNQITSSDLRNGQVNAADLARESVGGDEIDSGAVGSSEIGDGAVGGGEIAPNAVEGGDIADGTVSTGDIGNGQINSADIGNGEVTPDDVELPRPVEFFRPATEPAATVLGTNEFQHVVTLGTYRKAVADSALAVNWTGTVAAEFNACIFQLRVDGHSGDARGDVFDANGGLPTSVSATSLFSGLAAGDHSIEIWVRQPEGSTPNMYPCTVGPERTIGQTVIVTEQVT